MKLTKTCLLLMFFCLYALEFMAADGTAQPQILFSSDGSSLDPFVNCGGNVGCGSVTYSDGNPMPAIQFTGSWGLSGAIAAPYTWPGLLNGPHFIGSVDIKLGGESSFPYVSFGTLGGSTWTASRLPMPYIAYDAPHHQIQVQLSNPDGTQFTDAFPFIWPVGVWTKLIFTFALNAEGYYDYTLSIAGTFVGKGTSYQHIAPGEQLGVLIGIVSRMDQDAVSFDNISAGIISVPDGLVAYYPFNGNANDESGNGHNGIVHGATPTTDRFDTIGSALQFDGQSWIDVLSSPPLNPSKELTVAVWLNTDQLPIDAATDVNHAAQYAIAKGRDDQPGCYVLGIAPAWDNPDPRQFARVGFLIRDVNFAAPALYSTTLVQKGQWYSVVGTYDGASIKLFVNGVLEAQIDLNITLAANDSNLSIGRHDRGDFPYWFHGKIDDIRIYDRALSDNEVSEIYRDRQNTSPIADAGADKTTVVSSSCQASVMLDGTRSSDADGDSLTFSWTGAFGRVTGATPTVTLPKGVHTITLTVDDGKGGTATDSVVVTVVDNTPPVINIVPAADTLSSDASCHAMLPDLTGRVAATDNCTPLSGLMMTQSPVAGALLGVGTNFVTVRVQDSSNNAASTMVPVTVVNKSPTVSIAGNLSVLEGDTVVLSANGTDPEGGQVTYLWDLDGDGVFETSGQTVSFLAMDGPETRNIAVKAVDGCGQFAVSNDVVNIQNLPPTVSAITAPVDPMLITAMLKVSATFADPGKLDTHTATWNWGDGSTSSGTVTEVSGYGSAAGSHVYAASGVYRILLTVTDKDGGTGTSLFEYVVVYDPSAGFVTGSGWIISPVGAYIPNPVLTGKANFGFVSRYQKGANVPDGNTQFNFHAVGMDFKSTSYQWLVVSGAKAKYKGEGQINGAGVYGFMLTAVDGKQNGGGGQDMFRIKIWEKATGAIIYDNQPGAGDDSYAATVISAGSIVIRN